jgi:serine protease inhibitor
VPVLIGSVKGLPVCASQTWAVSPTAVTMRFPSGLNRADHPFVFMILDTRSGALLFLGRLSEPKE